MMVSMVFNMSRMVNLLMDAVMSDVMGFNCVNSTVMNRYRSDRMMRLWSMVKVMYHWRCSGSVVMDSWSWSCYNRWQRRSNSRAVMEGFRMVNGCQSSMNWSMSRLNRLMMEWSRCDGR